MLEFPDFVVVQLRLFPPAVAIVVVVSAMTRVLSCIPPVAPVMVVMMLLFEFMGNFSLSRYYSCVVVLALFITASVVDPFGNILGIMYNPRYLEILGSTNREN
jgi:hypothetical protein